MSKVENIHQVVNKKIASYTNYTGLIRNQHNFYYWGRPGFCQKGLKGGPRFKREGPDLFLDLIVPYIYYILLFREVGQALSPPPPPPPPLAKPLIMHIYGNVILSVQGNQFH